MAHEANLPMKLPDAASLAIPRLGEARLPSPLAVVRLDGNPHESFREYQHHGGRSAKL